MASAIAINRSGGLYDKHRPNRWLSHLLALLHRFVSLILRIVCRVTCTQHQKLPPIRSDIVSCTVAQLADKIRNFEVTSEAVVQAFIDRIKATNPILNYVTEERFEAALLEARRADDFIVSRRMNDDELKRTKPLLGVPFTTKNSIAVKGQHQTAGLTIRKDIIADKDAECIANLREAGAIPIAVTNVPELCMWWDSYNKLHGKTVNAYDNSKIVGGSSGGEGCIQSVAGSAFGIGSDIGGSIRMPAMFNGIFGHKPSKFLVSAQGHFPLLANDFQESLLGVGPMVRNASDMRLILKVISGKKAKLLRIDEYVSMKNINVYYQKDCLGSGIVSPVEKSIASALMKAVRHIEAVGGNPAKEVQFEKSASTFNMWMSSMNIAGATSFLKYQTGSDSVVNALVELVKSIFGRSDFTLVGLVNSLVWKALPSPGSEVHRDLLRLRQDLEDEFKDLLGNYGVLLYPTHPTAAPYTAETVPRAFNIGYTALVNMLGLPSTHVPMGLDGDGMPIGIQVVSMWNNDHLCLSVAEELEREFGGWIDPSKSKKNM